MKSKISIKCQVGTYKKLTELEEFQGPLKNLSNDAKEKLKKSILERGFNTPIFVWGSKILDGHQRLIALKELFAEGYQTDTLDGDSVPIIRIDAADEKEAATLVLQYNSQYGEITLEGLNSFVNMFDLDLSQIKDTINLSVDIGGFTEETLNKPTITEDEFDTDAAIEKPKYDVARGDIWALGEHRLMCGDSTNKEDVTRLLNGVQADLCFTDPPWNVDYGSQKNHPSWKARSIMNDSMSTEDFKGFMLNSFTRMNESLKEGAAVYVVMSAQEWGNCMLTLKEADFHWSSTVIWAKDSLVLSRKDYHTQYEPIYYGWKNGSPRLYPLEDRKQSDLWNIPRPKRSDIHPTMKPIELVARAIMNSTKFNDVVLDLFGGSGSTIIAAEQTKRKGITMELDPKYCSAIIERWETFSGRSAQKL